MKNFLCADELPNLQKEVMFYIYHSLTRDKTTTPITAKDISKKIGKSISSIKKTISRLKKKGFILSHDFKLGRHGWAKYSIPKAVAVKPHNFEKTKSNLNVHNNNNNNNTIIKSSLEKNSPCLKNGLPESWNLIEFEPVKKIGFSISQLKQLYNEGLNTPEVIQESIKHFSFALENNSKVKKFAEEGKALTVIMGVLRKGGNWFEANYEAPKDKALREIVQQKKAAKEKRNKLIGELVNLEFEEWVKSLSSSEVDEIVPEDRRRLKAAKTAALSQYFKEKVLVPRLEKEGLL